MGKNAESQNRNMKRLKDEQQVRQRAGVIFGTNDERGAFNGVREIIDNGTDEAREGRCNLIKVKVEKGDIVTVSDNGSGLPMDWNEEEQMYNWELALITLYASGKYDSSQYQQSVGLNGLGLTATQFASSFMDVWSTYDGYTRYMHFEKGKPIGDMKTTPAEGTESGTTIKFQPDPEVFPALHAKNLSANMFLTLLNSNAMLIDGLTIEFEHYELQNKAKFYYAGGMAEFVDKVVDEKKLLPKTAYFFDSDIGTDNPELGEENYRVDMRIAFNFCRDSSVIQIYHNGSYLFEGGKSVDGFEFGITKAFTDYARNTGKITRGDKFNYKDIESMLICVASTDAPGNRTWFKNQTKGAILNTFIGQTFTQFIYNKVRFWLENNKALSEKIVYEAIVNKKAREEGAEVSKKVVRSLSKAVTFSTKPKGFKDCSSKNVFERELYIVEGKSALGAVKTACNPRFQAVIGLRGKVLNCLKEKLTRILASEIIVDMFRVLGCGIEAKTKHLENLPEFDINKLNWGKIIICTDADVDGYHIRTLLITMFYVLAPTLLKKGKVFIAETPLFEITCKNDTRFAYTEDEKDAILKELKSLGYTDKQIKLERSKGLGENDADMMSKSTLNPLTRRLIPVEYPSDDSNLSMYFNALLGDDLETRKMLIAEYFDMTDSLD